MYDGGGVGGEYSAGTPALDRVFFSRRRFIVRNIVDASSMRDIRDASAYETYALPKIYIKQYYCIEAAVHQRIVRSRSRTDRRNRDPPPRFQRR